MEIKRKIYSRIKSWKEETKGKKALLIEGARRIGKSTVAEEFGKNEYETYIIVDFNTLIQSKNPSGMRFIQKLK